MWAFLRSPATWCVVTTCLGLVACEGGSSVDDGPGRDGGGSGRPTTDGGSSPPGLDARLDSPPREAAPGLDAGGAPSDHDAPSALDVRRDSAVDDGSAPSRDAPADGAEDHPEPTPTWGPLINGIQWADTAGNPIHAHGGGVIRVDSSYYWFGENRNRDGTFYAVSCYRSEDLRHWEFRKHVLTMDSAPELKPANIERPKVVYNASTGRFVMWMHWENGVNYGEARAAVASSSTVDGDYAYHGSFRPFADAGVTDHGKPGYMSRDCGLFVDDDAKAYFISASNENYDLNLYELTPDYLSIGRLVAVLFAGGHREAPALFKRNGVYFLLTSGATGWSPNQARYATSRALGSGWSTMTNVADGTTFHSQSTFVLPIQGGSATSYLYMGDRWAGAWGGRVNDSTYVWQPIGFPSDTRMELRWNNTLTIDAEAGTVSGATNRFHLVNRKSGKAMGIAEASDAEGAAVVQDQARSEDHQKWTLNYNGAGYFRLTNVGSGKVLDVPDESVNDGIELKQWTNHDGDNQLWRIVDVGDGDFHLVNKNSDKLVGVVGGSLEDGAIVEQRGSGGGSERRWRLVVAE